VQVVLAVVGRHSTIDLPKKLLLYVTIIKPIQIYCWVISRYKLEKIGYGETENSAKILGK